MGKILAYCAIMQDMEVTWMPSYGPEMRGGTANVCVIVSDRKISSPIVTKYDTAIILNQQSLDKFESTVKPGGLLIYDPNGIINPPTRTDIKVCRIDAINVAAQVGNSKVYNMAVMGAYLKMKPIVSFENIDKGLAKCIPARYIGKDPYAGRDWGQEEKGKTEDEMAGWHHRLDGHEFE